MPASPAVQVLPGSAIEGKVGKIPSVFNEQGLAHGLKAWQTREILPEELSHWSRGNVYNLCVRTGSKSGVYAFDVDIDDEALATRLRLQFLHVLPSGDWSLRVRNNSHKFLLPFQMDGSCKKRILKTTHGRIELLGDGQQFVACGTHSSGVRYEWEGGLPSRLPSLTASQMEALWAALSEKFSISPTVADGTRTSTSNASNEDDPVRDKMTDDEWNDLISALRHILRGDYASTNDGWSEIGYALLSIQHSRPARDLWLSFSKDAENYEPGAPERWWDAHSAQVPRSDYRHIFGLARTQGWGSSVSAEAFGLVPLSAPAVSVSDVSSEGKTIDLLPPEPNRPTIRIIGGNLPLCVEKCTGLLAPELYTNAAAELVKIGQAGADQKDGVKRSPFQPTMLRTISPEWLGVRLTELAVWERFDQRKGGWVEQNCPADLARTFYNLREWPTLRPLEAIVTAPFMREDGSVCDVPGYDAAARAIYAPNADFPVLAEAPTRDDAESALALLLAPFDEFPFVTDNGRSTFIAHILTEAARLSLDCSPMFWYTAADPEAGKSLLSEMPSYIVHGHAPARRPWPRHEDELRKVLMSSMLAGDRSMLFDNMPNGYKARAAELCAVLTAPEWQDRLLGVSRTPRVRNRLVISASGNNVTPVSDMARRSLVVRLIPPDGVIKGRRFKIPNLRAYVFKHRVDLLMAALTIMRAHQLQIATDTTEYPVLLPSFERWSERVRNPLIWLGLADPVVTQAQETDEETEGFAKVFTILGPMFGERPFLSTDVTKAAGNQDLLNDALIAANCDEPYSPKKVGYWLRANRDRVGGTWKLLLIADNHHGRQWKLTSLVRNKDLV